MATGRLGVSDLSAATDTSVYTCPADTFTVATISICNRGGTSSNIRIAVASSASPTSAEYLEYDAPIAANGVLERTGLVLDAGKIIVVRSSGANVSAVVMGIETPTI